MADLETHGQGKILLITIHYSRMTVKKIYIYSTTCSNKINKIINNVNYKSHTIENKCCLHEFWVYERNQWYILDTQ